MFSELPLLPADPILGLSTAFAADTNAHKIDLGVGVYKNELGVTPILECVHLAEQMRLNGESSKAYTNPAGYSGANAATNKLVFGEQHAALIEQRITTIQTPGGCGALRVAAELIQKSRPHATIWVSTPTWANHTPLLGSAGLQLREYPFYDYQNHCIDFDAMTACLSQIPAGDLVLLHACCHNPSGAKLSQSQWQTIAAIADTQGFTPFIDMAYQGFGKDVESDAFGVRLLAEKLPELLVATSFSKNFGLYRERAGALSIVAKNSQSARACLSQLLVITRGLYSMPPAHGSAIVDLILHDEALHKLWLKELQEMRERIQNLRQALATGLNQLQSQRDFSFIEQEQGMFSFLGLSQAQVTQLREQSSIYMTNNSRINLAGLNNKNIARACQSIAGLIQE